MSDIREMLNELVFQSDAWRDAETEEDKAMYRARYEGDFERIVRMVAGLQTRVAELEALINPAEPVQGLLSMRVVSKRDRIRSVVERWKEQCAAYLAEDYDWSYDRRDPKETLALLEALDLDTATERDVAAVIGNTMWTRLICEHCWQNADLVVVFGEEGDVLGRRPVHLCARCVREAMRRLYAHQKECPDDS